MKSRLELLRRACCRYENLDYRDFKYLYRAKGRGYIYKLIPDNDYWILTFDGYLYKDNAE